MFQKEITREFYYFQSLVLTVTPEEAVDGAAVVVVLVEFWLWTTTRRASNTTNSFRSDRAIFRTLTDVPSTITTNYLYETHERNKSFFSIVALSKTLTKSRILWHGDCQIYSELTSRSELLCPWLYIKYSCYFRRTMATDVLKSIDNSILPTSTCY